MKRILLITVVTSFLIVIAFTGIKFYKTVDQPKVTSEGCDVSTYGNSIGRFHKQNGLDGITYTFGRPFKGYEFSLKQNQIQNFSEDFLGKLVYINTSGDCDGITGASVQIPEEQNFFIFKALVFDDWKIEKTDSKVTLYAPIENDYLGKPDEKLLYMGKSDDPDKITIEKIPFKFNFGENKSYSEAVSAYFEENFPPVFHFDPWDGGPESQPMEADVDHGGYVQVDIANGNKAYFYFLDNNIYQFTFIPGRWQSNRDNSDVFELLLAGLKLKKLEKIIR